MDQATRARQIAEILLQALQIPAVPQAASLTTPAAALAPWARTRRFTVARRPGCPVCRHGTCRVCGHRFLGEAIIVAHPVHGKHALSDRAVHYLSHGLTHYETGDVIDGQAVSVDLDLVEIAGYLDL